MRSLPTFSDALWIETPLLYSSQISARLDCDVYLKLENLQPPLSFKYRGISHFAANALQEHGPSVHLMAASSGNAGLALAYAAKQLGARCTIFIPSAAVSIKPVLERENAQVVVGGKEYIDALRAAKEAFAREEHAVMVPSYDDPLIWEGHSSMIHEIKRQLPGSKEPAAIFCSVGGGGLIGGILKGCNDVGWNDAQIVGNETCGSNCFHRTMVTNTSFRGRLDNNVPSPLREGIHLHQEGEVTIASLEELNSRAASLGATSPSIGVVGMALKRGNVHCVSVPDELSMEACTIFAEEQKILVELACSTTLVPAYNPKLFHAILSHEAKPEDDTARRVVVFVICGGAKISLPEVEEYRKIVNGDLTTGRFAFVDIEKVEW